LNVSIGFGDAEVDEVLQHFAPVMAEAGYDVEEVSGEWSLLKSSIYNR
jgi:hypothetical protein